MPLPPLAFGFANAAILGWLAAAAAPILIHLWMKRVRRETEWAAVRFLRKAIERHSRKLKLREWLLLAVRTAIILCVVLAAAKPVLEGLGLAGPGVRTHYVLAVDASLSMRYEPEAGASLLDKAKRLAGELIEGGRSGDLYSVVTLAAPPRVLIGAPIADAGRVRRAVESIEPTDGGADLDAAVTLVEQQLDRQTERTSRVDRREVVVFTDLARHTWAGLASEKSGGDAPRDAALAARLDRVAESAALSVIDLGVDRATNTAVSRVAVDDPLPTAGRPLRVSATATLHGPLAAGGGVETEAELLVNGLAVATRPVRLTPGSAKTIDFAHRFERPGAHAIEVRLAGDQLAADDSGWLGVTLPERTRVLCVAGAPGAARNVASALRPFGAEAGEYPIEPTVVSDAELAAVELNDYAAVFFCNVAQLGRREAERVEAYARGGGGVVFFLGDRVVADAYNQTLSVQPPGEGDVGLMIDGAAVPLRLVSDEPADGDAERGLLPVTIDRPVSTPGSTIDPLDYRHPIVRPFEGRERAGLLTTPISRYWRLLAPDDASGVEAAFATASGDPLLVTAPVGRGRVAVVATAGSLASVDAATGEPWTAMPAWPSFLPIVRGLLRDVAGAGRDGAGAEIGQPIGGVAPAGAVELEVLPPGGVTPVSAKPVSARTDDSGGWLHEATDRAGVYRVRRQGGVDAFAAVAVNVPAEESSLLRVAAKELPGSLTVRRVAARATAGDALPTETGLHRTLLLAALALVLVETAMAYGFGRPPA